jgi:hypothetical protein
MLSGLKLSQILHLGGQLEDILVRVPGDGVDVCPICRSWRHERFPLCSNCMEVSEMLARPCELVIPITLYRKPSALREILTYYKPGRDRLEPQFKQFVAIIFDLFLHYNSKLLWDVVGGFDVVTNVPSTHAGGTTLRDIISVDGAFGAPFSDLLRRGEGDLGSRVMSDDGFEVIADVSGRRVLLIDDVYTTGARAQSAASALQMKGSTVVAVLTIARRVNPEFNEASKRLWCRQAALSYSFRSAMDWLIE